MQQCPAEAVIGDRYQDSEGDTWVVAELDDRGRPSLVEDQDLIEDPSDIDAEVQTWTSVAGDYGPLVKVDSNPELTALLEARAERSKEIAEVVNTVAPEQVRDLYNTIAGFRHWGAKLTEAQGKVNSYSGHRAKELRKIVEIVGTQDKAAKLLGMNQSTLSRALRPRSEA
jgi:predicted transcriptional regulator